MRTRSAALGALLLIVAMVAAACGGASSGENPAGNGPVVQHRYGSTQVPAQPKRVVTLGMTDHETVLALGIKPVGVVDWFGERPFGNWPWSQQLWGGQQPDVVGQRDEYNMEKIAELKPDLIIAEYSGMRREQYDKLSAIAPTVAQSPRFPEYGAPWQEMTRMIGQALNQPAKAEELVARTEGRFAEVRKQHPEFAQQTLALVDTYRQGAFGAFPPADAKSLFMQELGFKSPPQLTAAIGDKAVAEFGYEQMGMLDVDRLVWMTSDEVAANAVRTNGIYRSLNVVKDGRDLFLSYQNPPVGAAISFNTVLSIPYAIDQVVPQLARPAR
ncbi:iron-siderophore ABC transporter substrate-binding protein [Saccharopolyspora erythraea]|uniref:iron-siderophore ABC transporter substrate-binding protein n=1 Tax=Saccharopolyspora erythraea TaxID=1836 RepID=UPI001BA8B11A|nr:iron-siderophore ABC transporter substrate-binding protein [Saccharopolyspora erythraea]QUH03435.1 iron-siderophore ABC transporter substrate-binding protein [Saccharopolyspora erythraea]